MTNENGTNNTDERGGCTSASNAAADELCPGRFQAQLGLTINGDNEYASLGRKVHRALALREPADLNVRERETYDRCVQIEAQLLNLLTPLGGKAPICLREHRFWMSWDRGDRTFRHSGKPDVVYRNESLALILEYKTLFGDVPEAPSNKQLRDQVVLVDRNADLPPLQAVYAGVIQPGVTMTPETCVYRRIDIDRACADLKRRVEACWAHEPPRYAGTTQCEHCEARLHCATYQQWAGALVPGLLSVLNVPVANWSPEQRAIFCQRESVARKWLDETKDAIKELMVKEPLAVPGYYLKPGSIRKVIKDPTTLFERFQKIGGTLAQFMKCIDVRKMSLADAVNQATGARGVNLGRAVETLTEGLTEDHPNKPSIAKRGKLGEETE